MATIEVYNLSREKTGEVELHDKIIEAKINPFVIKDAVVATLARARQGTHKTKERSEVKGSRRKLFRQKGTGNARAGSAQSPVRRHGGTVFGPVPRSHEIKLNKKVRKQAMTCLFGEKFRNQQILVVDELSVDTPKTKEVVQIMKNLKLGKTLFVFSSQNENFALACRNLPNVTLTHSSGINPFELLRHPNLVITKDALLDVEGRLLR